MQPKKKTGVGHNKNFGKLTFPPSLLRFTVLPSYSLGLHKRCCALGEVWEIRVVGEPLPELFCRELPIRFWLEPPYTQCNSYNGVKFKLNTKLTIESVGPIQKLSVPDFQHINSVFEQMQSEILEKPSKAR